MHTTILSNAHDLGVERIERNINTIGLYYNFIELRDNGCLSIKMAEVLSEYFACIIYIPHIIGIKGVNKKSFVIFN